MKKHLIVFFTFIYSITMSQEVISIKYSAFTRGTSKEIVVNEKGVISNKNDKKLRQTEGKSTLSQCQKLIKNINLESISALKAPSKRRASDGALHASIEIITKDKTYQSNEFDEGNPPKELKKLVDYILKMAN
jgi:hypothetical protein